MIRTASKLFFVTVFMMVFFVSSALAAETYTVSGTVKEYNIGALKGVKVEICMLKPTRSTVKNVTTTDLNGKYSFNVAPGEYVLYVPKSGYPTLSRVITVSANTTQNFILKKK